MTNVSAVEKMAELMQQMEESSPRVAALQYCLKQVAEKVEDAEKRNAELEARCAALAAENAGLNEKMNKLATWPGIEFYSSAWEFNGGDGDTALEFMCDVQTPSTDAFLAELRAQGAEECVRQLVISDDDDFSDAPNICAMVAHQLRQEAQ
ncbi:hypothetical protein [Enterobacter hormaechei]|uniref:hypothetical protein n=1 Tax=Enterobacter hormaechei TaxID=158836 RepID=UPI001F081552|nr:hypothetical protein [Enterobacter hormaechei]